MQYSVLNLHIIIFSLKFSEKEKPLTKEKQGNQFGVVSLQFSTQDCFTTKSSDLQGPLCTCIPV